jgi:hypothetical protein
MAIRRQPSGETVEPVATSRYGRVSTALIVIGIPQVPRQHLHHVVVDFRIGFSDCVEIGLVDKAQCRLAEGRDRSGAGCAVDHGQFAHYRLGAEDSKDAFTAVGRADARFEQTILYRVASTSLIPARNNVCSATRILSARARTVKYCLQGLAWPSWKVPSSTAVSETKTGAG